MTGRADWDVIVAGAGPGGSTIAALLAMAGKRVLVVERETFPRFHIGESLLPASGLVRSVLGIEPDPADFFHKRGAQFIDESTGRVQTFDFAEALPGPQRFAWHVERARFDKILRDRAEELGAVLRHRFIVEDVDTDADGVRVRIGPAGEGAGDAGSGERTIERGRYFIDATGQDRFLARKHGSGRPLERFGRAAVFTHFAGLSPEAQAEIGPHNDIRVVIIPDGWLWGIPLTGHRLSVGMVKRTPGLRRSDPDWHAVQVMNQVLGGSGFTSRLMKKIRSDEGLTYGIGTRYSEGPYWRGDLSCGFQTKNSSVAYAMRLALDIIDGMKTTPVPAEELKVIQDGIIESFPSQFSNRQAIARLFASEQLSGWPEDFYANYREKILGVTAADVQRVAKKYLTPEQMVLLVVGKADEAVAGDKAHPGTLAEVVKLPLTRLPLRDPLTLKPLK